MENAVCIAHFNFQVANRASSNQETLNDHEVRALPVSAAEREGQPTRLPSSSAQSGPKLCKISLDRCSKAAVLVAEGSHVKVSRGFLFAKVTAHGSSQCDLSAVCFRWRSASDLVDGAPVDERINKPSICPLRSKGLNPFLQNVKIVNRARST